MPRHYIRVDPQFYERKALAQKYPPGAVAALVGCFCLAESQPTRGRFRDRKVLGVLLGPQARWIPFLIEHNDLLEREDLPRLYVDGWDDWQEGDVTVPERMARLRAKKARRTAGVTLLDTPEVTARDTPPVTGDRQTETVEAVSGDKDKGGDGRPYNGAAKPGYRQPPELGPGEARVPSHHGQHPNCIVCEPIRAAMAEAPPPTARPRAVARPRKAASSG
jgi:hypothetical protein